MSDTGRAVDHVGAPEHDGSHETSGPLAGVTIVELAGLGPAPFAGMLLADLGAEVIRIDRPPRPTSRRRPDPLDRGRRSIVVDLKRPGGADVVLGLCRNADALVEGFRPGVAERLGIGPVECGKVNPALVYGRMTGWGQDGPSAGLAGHDINYLSLTGALAAIGPAGGPPVPPLNLVADFGGGGMLLALGVVCAVLEARSSGAGQVVDASMVDGASLLMSMTYGFRAEGAWTLERGANRLDGGAPFYGVYQCADGRHVAVGAIEPQFYRQLIALIGADPGLPDRQDDRSAWPADRAALAAVLASRTRDEWCERLEHTDACVTPVLDLAEAGAHPHNVARGTFFERDGAMLVSPAPRFDRTPTRAGADHRPGAATAALLSEAGFDQAEIEQLLAAGVVAPGGEGGAP